MKKITICLYLEFYTFLGGFMYKNIGTGLLSSYQNQQAILKQLGIPYTLTWRDSCDVLQINTPWLWSLVLIRRARRLNKKVIIWAHVTAEDIKGVFWFGNLVSPFMKSYLTYAYGKADIICAPTEYTKRLLIAYGIPAEKIVPMSNGVDTSVFRADAEKRTLGRTQYHLDAPVIGTVGLAIPRKGISSFIEIAKQFPSAQCMWFGKIYSPLMAKPLPKDLPSNCTFTGYVDDIIAAFNAIDIFVFLSHEENEGMAILEAAAVGLPIIVRDIPVYEGWLVDGENCLKAKDDAGFVACVRRIMEDDALKAKLCAGARALAESRSMQAMAARTQSMYENLTAQ